MKRSRTAADRAGCRSRQAVSRDLPPEKALQYNGPSSRLMKRMIIFVIAVLTGGGTADAMALRNLDMGEVYPSFCARQHDGGQLCSDAFDNTVLIAAFLRPDQQKSQKVSGSLQDLQDRYGKRGVTIIGVVSGELKDSGLSPLSGGGQITFPLLLDRDRSIYGSFGVIAYPTITVFGRDGKLAYLFGSNTLSIGNRLEGCIRFLTGEIDAAELEKIIHPVVEKIDKERAKAERYYNFARNTYDRKQFAKARKILESSLKNQSEHAPSFALYGNILIQEGDFELALQQFEQALSIDPELEEAQIGRQRCLDTLGQ